MTVEDVPPEVIALYHRFVELVSACGPFAYSVTKQNIGFRGQRCICGGVHPTAHGLDGYLDLPRALEDERFRSYEIQPIPGPDRQPEPRVLHHGEHGQDVRAGPLAHRGRDQPAAELRHGLDQEHARHDGIAGKVIPEEVLVWRKGLDAGGLAPDIQRDDAIDQNEAHAAVSWCARSEGAGTPAA